MAKERYRIVVTELPYQTNKAALVERIATLTKSRKLEGIAELRDESDREGVRIVIELKRDGQPKQVLNNLYRYTGMQSAFFANMLALVDVQPRMINLKAALQHHINFRRQVVIRRSQFELEKAREKAHILEGLKIALDYLDAVIATIRESETVEAAQDNLMKSYSLSQAQAQAILTMELRRLAALERDKITTGYTEVLKTISYLEDLLASPRKIDSAIKAEVEELRSRYGDERRTQISAEEVEEFSTEDLIPHQQMVVTLSQRGYIKRLPSESYKSQHRGGRGVVGMITREADAVQHLVIADTHDNLLLFTNRGRVLPLKCHRIPQESSRQAKGMPIINLLPLDGNEQVTAAIAISHLNEAGFIVLATRLGEVKRSELSQFSSIRHSGVIAMPLKAGDELAAVTLAAEGDEVILVTEGGRALRFAVSDLRVASRSSGGVRGIGLAPGDRVVGMDVASADSFLVTITAKGYGKRVPLAAYRVQRRGGNGLKSYRLGPRTGPLVAAIVARPSQELMVASEGGLLARISIEDISLQRRTTQGVSVMRLAEGDTVASIACLSGEGNR
jgi:DNA gyrase subunit A